MKKNLFTFPFKSNFFKEQDPFHLVIIFFIIFFGTAIFFSIPTFYDYTKYNLKIEKTINKEFKINMKDLKNISYRFVPSPHLLIKKANLKIRDDEKVAISELEDIKVFISILDLYKKDTFNIDRIEVNKSNFYLNNLSLNNFIYNLKKNIVKKFIIKKSNIFFKDEKNEIILISTIKNFEYKIDFINYKKILDIEGNIFDADYNFDYIIDYKTPNIQNINLELKNPNINIKNELIEDKDLIEQLGKLNISFLSQKNSINYKIKKNYINFFKQNLKNSNFDLTGSINFEPFYFDLLVNLKTINLEDIENLLYNLYKNQNLKFENLSGIFKINFDKIDSKLFNSGNLGLKIENSKMNISDNDFNVNDFASLKIIDYEYLENDDQILQIKIKVDVKNLPRLNRFLFNYQKDKIKSKEFFVTYQYNNSDNTSYISQISNKGFNNNPELYRFNNIQQLKNIFKDENFFNSD